MELSPQVSFLQKVAACGSLMLGAILKVGALSWLATLVSDRDQAYMCQLMFGVDALSLSESFGSIIMC